MENSKCAGKENITKKNRICKNEMHTCKKCFHENKKLLHQFLMRILFYFKRNFQFLFTIIPSGIQTSNFDDNVLFNHKICKILLFLFISI